jgi:hypothetical protein
VTLSSRTSEGSSALSCASTRAGGASAVKASFDVIRLAPARRFDSSSRSRSRSCCSSPRRPSKYAALLRASAHEREADAALARNNSEAIPNNSGS